MFLVFNKEKVIAYIVSILTVCCLFLVAGNVPQKEETKSTFSNVQLEKNVNDVENVNNKTTSGNNKGK